MTLAPGAKLDLGTLRIRGAIQVVGRVVDADGSALAGVRVSAVSSSRWPAGGSPQVSRADPGGELYAVTDSGGGFSLPLPTGEHHVTASAPGRTDAVATVQVGSAGGTAALVNLRFAKNADLIVEGLVRDSAGRPLSRADVSLNSAADVAAMGTARGGSSPVAAGITDAGGHFRLSGLPGHSLLLRVHHASYASYQRAVLPGTATGPLIVEVPIPGAIEGEVHEKSTGAPVTGFEITAQGPDTATTRYPETGHRRRDERPVRCGFRCAKWRPGPGLFGFELPDIATSNERSMCRPRRPRGSFRCAICGSNLSVGSRAGVCELGSDAPSSAAISGGVLGGPGQSGPRPGRRCRSSIQSVGIGRGHPPRSRPPRRNHQRRPRKTADRTASWTPAGRRRRPPADRTRARTTSDPTPADK